MKFQNILSSGALLVSCLSAVNAMAVPCQSSPAKAVYFMSNKDKGNSIHALAVDQNGLLSAGTVTPTGGKGDRANPVAGDADSLASQSALVVMGNYLFAVNAGSNTLSMMWIDPQDPLKLSLVGCPVDTVGQFPNTVAVSQKLNLACVGTTGPKAGIECFKICSSGLIPDGQAFRPIYLDPVQALPPNGPLNTLSQVFFSEAEDALLATVKGNPVNISTDLGYLGYWPVNNGMVSTQAITSSPAGTAVMFGTVALPGSNYLISDASFGYALVNVKNGKGTTLKKVTIPDQVATCWTAQSPATGLIYTTDDGNEQIAAVDPNTGAMLARNVLNLGIPNLIEINGAADKLYALSHGNRTIKPHVIVAQTLGASGQIQGLQAFMPMDVGIHVSGIAVY